MNTSELTRSAHLNAPPPIPKKRNRIAADFSRRVEHTLKRRAAPEGTVARKVEGRFKRNGMRAWELVKRRPSLGIVAAGGVGFVLASAVGVGELLIAVSAAYAAYEVLREDVPPADAVRESIELVEGGGGAK